MPVVPIPQVRPNRSQGPWDRRDVAELSQTSFRTTLRGFDRDEVRAILDSVAADYRVLQLQNASLQRQLADLEAVLQAYHRSDASGHAASGTSHALQRANDEARAILMRAHAEAGETMARAAERAREAERPLEQFEEDRKHFRALLAGTVTQLLGVLNVARRNPDEVSDDDKQLTVAGTLLLDASPAAPAAASAIDVPASSADDRSSPPRDERNEADDRGAPSVALVPVASPARRADEPVQASTDSNLKASEFDEPIDLNLKDIDMALVEIPALQCE